MGERVIKYLLARLREPSTWRGIILLATALGVSLKPEVWEAIVTLGLALAGAVGAAAPDQPVGMRGVQDSPGDGPQAPGDSGDGFRHLDGWADRD